VQPPEDEAAAHTLTQQWYPHRMGKREPKHPFEDNPFVEDFRGWMDSPEGELSGEVLDTVWSLLEHADVDATHRQIIWDDGKRLSVTESVARIHADYPDLPVDLIDAHLVGWLEMGFAPETYTQEQLDELDRLTEKWIEDHDKQAKTSVKTAKKRARTRHS
jgi:hypothetical protein